MGLDQTAMFFKGDKPSTPVFFYTPHKAKEFWTWRNHHTLKEWIGAIFKKHGCDDHNGRCLLLDTNDLKALKKTIQMNLESLTTKYTDQDLLFIEKSLRKIDMGYHIYYCSDW